MLITIKMEQKPLVSIGMPVYNGERFLRQALDSLVVQDYANFELIISDNASQDGTKDICLEYVRKDGRIRYGRQQTNIGVVGNFNRVFQKATGKYFMWAAYDDLWEPGFISRCVQRLEAKPEAVLCSSYTKIIDPENNEKGIVEQYEFPDLKKRVWDIMSRPNAFFSIYGLIRRESLARTRLCRPIIGSDVVMLTELCFLGPFAVIPEPLFFYRKFPGKRIFDAAKLNYFWFGSESGKSRDNYHSLVLCLFTKTWLSYLGAILRSQTRKIRKIYYLATFGYLFFPLWYKQIAYVYRSRVYDDLERRETGKIRKDSILYFLFKPQSVIDYDFMCIFMKALLGEKIFTFASRIKQTFARLFIVNCFKQHK